MSLCAPYDSVAHGGGQNHNYYIKYFKKNLEADITLLTLYAPSEKEKLDFDKYGIKHISKEYDKSKAVVAFQNALGKLFVHKHGGLLDNKAYHLFLDEINEYVSLSEVPDVVITQWTETSLLIDKLKMHFPNAIYIAIEEDVAFLGYERKYLCSKGIMRLYKWLKYKFLKIREIDALKQYNIVVPLNKKDENVLIENGISPNCIFRSCSYHGLYSNCNYSPNKYDLLFYGAMNRKENYESVIWFIENVMTHLDSKYRLFVVGGNPGENIKKYSSDQIIVTGFVDNVSIFFENCLCLVAPLLLGAGIKIKVLEALSAGLPVITNEIGAEGIGLTDRVNFLFCENPAQYVDAIQLLSKDEIFRNQIGENGKLHIEAFFDVDNYLNRLIKKILELVE